MAYFLFIDPSNVILGHPSLIAWSDRTIDVQFAGLARCRKVRQLLNLFSGGTESEHAVAFFASYLSAFYPQDQVARYAFMMTNPVVRVLLPTVARRNEVNAAFAREFFAD
jgi:hypothetical protein